MHLAIQHGNKVLDWMENLVSDEVPPEWMWPFDDEIEAWFATIQAERDQKYGTNNAEDEVVPLSQNEYARGRGG